MLKLSFYQKGAAVPDTSMELAELRASGATLWNPVDRGLIATYSNGSWKHHGRDCPILAVTGGGRLVFGISRDPTIVSDPIDHFYLIGPTLSANGVAIARYIEQQDMWQGVLRPMWWNAMRLLSVDTVSAAVDEAHVAFLNPWEPHSIHNAPHMPEPQLGPQQESRRRQPATAAHGGHVRHHQA
jgi:hypothetical protein